MVARANRPRIAEAGARGCRSFVVVEARLQLQGAPNIAVQ